MYAYVNSTDYPLAGLKKPSYATALASASALPWICVNKTLHKSLWYEVNK